jgi:hypothetical protein
MKRVHYLVVISLGLLIGVSCLAEPITLTVTSRAV